MADETPVRLQPEHAIPCPCPGFRWVDLDGPHVGSYTDPPQR